MDVMEILVVVEAVQAVVLVVVEHAVVREHCIANSTGNRKRRPKIRRSKDDFTRLWGKETTERTFRLLLNRQGLR